MITVSKFKEMSFVGYDVLLEADTIPMAISKNIDGVKLTIFAFGLDYSNLPILFYDFPVLINNLADYSIKPTFEKTVYNAGEVVLLEQNPMTESLVITNKEGETVYQTFPVEIDLDTLGTHVVTQVYSDGRTKTESFYVRVPETESNFTFIGDVLETPPTEDIDVPIAEKSNLQDLIMFFGIGLLVLVIIEWEVQHREQY